MQLLPDLTYNDKMTVLFVYNGHWMLEHNKWDTTKMINKEKKCPLHFLKKVEIFYIWINVQSYIGTFSYRSFLSSEMHFTKDRKNQQG